MNMVLDMTKRQHTIAVIDDDPSLRKALARLLSVFGYRAELYASAAEFLSAVETSKAACLVVDIGLGDVSGLDLARQLSAAGFQFPIIFVTGSDDDTVRTRCMDLGCVAYLQKPFREGRLIDAIARTLGPSVQPA